LIFITNRVYFLQLFVFIRRDLFKNDYQFTDLELPPGTADTCLFSVNSKSNLFPTYEEILNGTEIKVVIELDANYSIFNYRTKF
jgi:hypothetical protein